MKHPHTGNRSALRGRKLIWGIVFLALLVTLLGGSVFVSSSPTWVWCYGPYDLLEKNIDEELLVNVGYSVGYSDARENPLWVAYRLCAVSDPISHDRPSRFKIDMRTAAQVSHDDYTNSGYDRGHMAPNAAIDYCYGRDAQLETFYMSNVCPQTPSLNRGIWATLEETIRDWANALGEVWVFTGPVFDDEIKTLVSGVEIPDAFYKIIIDEANSFPRVIAFLLPQGISPGMKLDSYLTSVDEVEEKTGFNFLRADIWYIDPATEERIESYSPTQLWTITCTGIFELGRVDAGAECITLRNVSDKAQCLSGWAISDGEGQYTFPYGVVNAGDTYTVCMSTYNPKEWKGGLYLNDEHDEVYLLAPNGDVCDEVTW